MSIVIAYIVCIAIGVLFGITIAQSNEHSNCSNCGYERFYKKTDIGTVVAVGKEDERR